MSFFLREESEEENYSEETEDAKDSNCGPDTRAYACDIHDVARSRRRGAVLKALDLLKNLTDLLGGRNLEEEVGEGGGYPRRTVTEGGVVELADIQEY